MNRSWSASPVLVMAAATLLAGCGAPLPSHYEKLTLTAPDDVTLPGRQHGAVKAFFATNREPTGTGAAQAYTARRGDGITFGACDIRVDRYHKIGNDVVAEQLSRMWQRTQPGPLTVTATRPAASAGAFFDALRSELRLPATPPTTAPATAPTASAAPATCPAGGDGRDVLVLVHGYNTTFTAAVQRAAEVAYDLGSRVVPVAYCWSSQGTYQGYPYDENDVDAASRHLASFLADLIRKVPEARLHLIAHSMGSRVTTQALARLKAGGTFARPPFCNLVFAAADIDAAEFKARVSTAPGCDGLAALACRTTLYAAVYDRALEASEYFHGRTYPRAGRAGESILVLPGVDTVDVSLNDASLVGHGYYGDNRAVITDLHMLLVLNEPPERRNLYKATKDGLNYWLIRP